eukprot:scaffold7099_cov281-Pinguiococcus_pyrenoidosus.AAC.25
MSSADAALTLAISRRRAGSSTLKNAPEALAASRPPIHRPAVDSCLSAPRLAQRGRSRTRFIAATEAEAAEENGNENKEPRTERSNAAEARLKRFWRERSCRSVTEGTPVRAVRTSFCHRRGSKDFTALLNGAGFAVGERFQRKARPKCALSPRICASPRW